MRADLKTMSRVFADVKAASEVEAMLGMIRS
jgi:hypothetical protein